MSSPSELTRYTFAVVMVVILSAQFVIYASTRRRPKWFIIAELIAMACTLLAGSTSLASPSGLMVAGVFILFGFTEFLVATAVYLYQQDRVDAVTFLQKYWYVPAGIITLFLFFFVSAERSINRGSESDAQILSQAKKNSAIGTKNLQETESLNKKADKSMAQRERQLTMLDELSDILVKLVMPMRSDIHDIKIEIQRKNLRDQKQDKEIEQLKRNKYNTFP